jgi:hypothetical protein
MIHTLEKQESTPGEMLIFRGNESASRLRSNVEQQAKKLSSIKVGAIPEVFSRVRVRSVEVYMKMILEELPKPASLSVIGNRLLLALAVSVTIAHDLFILRQYSLLDHVSGVRIDRVSNSLTRAVSLLPARHRDKIARGSSDDLDFSNHKTIIEGDGHISSD